MTQPDPADFPYERERDWRQKFFPADAQTSYDAEIDGFLKGLSAYINGDPMTGNYGRIDPYGRTGRWLIDVRNWERYSDMAGIPGAEISDPAAQDRVARWRSETWYRRYSAGHQENAWPLVAAAWIVGEQTADAIAMGQGWKALKPREREVVIPLLQRLMPYVPVGEYDREKLFPTTMAIPDNPWVPDSPWGSQMYEASAPAASSRANQVMDETGSFTNGPGRAVALMLDGMSRKVARGQRVSVRQVSPEPVGTIATPGQRGYQ